MAAAAEALLLLQQKAAAAAPTSKATVTVGTAANVLILLRSVLMLQDTARQCLARSCGDAESVEKKKRPLLLVLSFCQLLLLWLCLWLLLWPWLWLWL